MKIGNHKHRVERRSHVRISAARSPLSDPLFTNHDPRSTIHHPLATSHASRRGVLLLLILALLAMFGLIAVAFVVLTGQAQRSAKSIERIDLAMDPPKNLLQQAAMQVFRGTNNPSSVLGPHSLLEDMYGDAYSTTYPSGYITGSITSVDVACGGQLLKIVPNGAQMTAEILARHGGCVLTITKLSNAATQQAVYGQSTRIVYVEPNSTTFYILAFPDGANITGYPSNLAGASFTINGAPFSGTGFGYTSSGFDGTTALKPNNASNRIPLGGANEDYDAADYQNMLLAAQVYNSTSKQFDTLPSLHRPALIQAKGETVDYVLRPLKATHTNFSGSNSNYTATAGPWDVDNDGDGVPDSIWVDLGMPPRATNDGRLYKPLFAILCTDLDGRLNVNAHGSWAQTDTTTIAAPTGHVFAGGTPSATQRGFGYGPAEIALTTTTALSNWQNLLSYRYAKTGWIGGDAGHYLNLNKWLQYGNGNYWAGFSTANNSGVYGAPPDVTGMGIIGLDWGGRPLYCFMGQNLAETAKTSQCPYEFDLSAGRNRGSNAIPGNVPFSPSELERLLRPYDRDATALPSRLASLVATPGSAVSRATLTTDSWDVPASMYNKLLLLVISKGGLSETAAQPIMHKLFAPELLAGRKMDLNRAFGNSLDDDSNGVVDESEPAESGEKVSAYTTSAGGTASRAASYDPTGTVAANALQGRQLYARYLYVLAKLLVDETALKNSEQYMKMTWPTDVTTPEARVARFLAQWAVNVVDFYDRDSIMTPFSYVDNPFTSSGWTASVGAPTSTTNLVWGCERPELLITETLAFHDRRTQDLDDEQHDAGEAGDSSTENGFIKKAGDTEPKDDDASFDQQYKPQGSLFVELYNPWSDLEPSPGELSDSGGEGVDLTKTSGSSPVWRLVITSSSADPDTETVTIDRSVYFTGSGTTAGTVKFEPTATMKAKIAPILPGRYALIGPGEKDDTTNSTTYFGFASGNTPGSPGADDRRIILTPSNNTETAGQVDIFNNGTKNDLPTTGVKNPTAIVINSPCRLNISQPDPATKKTDGYPDNGPDGTTAYSKTDGYATAYDVPLDADANLMNNERTDCIKVIHLQRLANPLLAYNATTNPYRTIDSMPIDLLAFNGLEKTEDPKASPKANVTDGFYARQRGANTNTTLTNDLWTQEPLTGSTPTINSSHPSVSSFAFNAPLSHTLAYLNSTYGTPNSTAGAVGDPSATPFVWLNWNNRPFVNQYELMLVPWAASSRLCYNFGMTSGTNPYTGLASPFVRLLSFFNSTKDTDKGCEFHRILDFTEVPSRFVGTEIQVNPANATGPFLPPFNRIPNYREPGKVNLNTIYNKEVYDGLMNGRLAPDWANFVKNRRGFTGGVLALPAAACPTEFAHPFRSFTTANLVPSDIDELVPHGEVNVTLLREGPTAGTPLFDYSSSSSFNNTDRNPFFRYQDLTRLGNLVTTRSNVYAVWITVGYFEVTRTAVSATYPDGCILGQELGVDTGEIDRHRAFYIFDRSIPVGFQRGQDLNVEKAILVNRYIE